MNYYIIQIILEKDSLSDVHQTIESECFEKISPVEPMQSTKDEEDFIESPLQCTSNVCNIQCIILYFKNCYSSYVQRILLVKSYGVNVALND
jgi:hypothetical protein